MSVSFNLLVDGLLIVLLLATLIYVGRLNRRLGQIRDARREFEALIARLTEATDQTDRSIAGIRAAAEAEGKELQAAIDRSRGLREDLAFLSEKANGVADRLEGSIKRARKPDAARAQPAVAGERPSPLPRRAPAEGAPGRSAGGPEGQAEGEPISAGDRDLLDALASAR